MISLPLDEKTEEAPLTTPSTVRTISAHARPHAPLPTNHHFRAQIASQPERLLARTGSFFSSFLLWGG